MKKLFLFLGLSLIGSSSFADASKFSVKIVDLHNIDRGHSMEACGTAVHADGKKPLLVLLTHDLSKFTTLTSEDGKWCVVFKRWNNKGEITVSASTLDYSEKSIPIVK